MQLQLGMTGMNLKHHHGNAMRWAMGVVAATLALLGTAIGVRHAAKASPRPATPAVASIKRVHPVVKNGPPTPSPDLVQVNPSGLLWIPRSCAPSGEPLDVIFHFHGVPYIVKNAVENAGLNVIVSVDNEGELSASYRDAWSSPRAFEGLLEETRTAVQDYCDTSEPRLGRIALSSFSAGFAAVQQLLDHTEVFDRVDAVLLEDSLYAAYANPNTKEISEQGLTPFVAFGRAAVRSDKLMAITHSAIATPNYASTVETADYLLRKLGIERHPAPNGDGTEAEQGSFWLLGQPGTDAAAHSKHLQGMGHTVLPRLAARWHRTRSVAR